MANPYQTALMSRLNPNRNTGISGIYSQNGQVNAPPLQPGFVETPPEGPPPTLGTGNPTPPMEPPPAIDTKGPATGSMRDRLLGFDAGKLDSGHNTPKYVFARHAQNFDDRDASSRDALINALRGDASGFFKDARLEGDILKGSYDPDTGGYGDVDIIKGLKAGGEGWQWGAMPGSVQGGGAQPVSGGAPPMVLPPTTGMRTQDFQDADNSGVDDRDEPQQAGFDTQSPYLKALLAQLGL